jgi:hypothetical protein
MSERELQEWSASQIMRQGDEDTKKLVTQYLEGFPLNRLKLRLATFLYRPPYAAGSPRVIAGIVRFVCGVIIYGGLAIVIAALFGIDFVYRHFA